jgi:UDP-glucose 4-epimerase
MLMNVVTGGLGFIGNELVRQLLGAGEEVVILDNRSRVAPDISDIAAAKVMEVDLTQHERVAAMLTDLKPEVVFHLAAIHFIPECNANPVRTLRVNVEATMGLLQACAVAKVRHFLFASSGAIYADTPLPLNEESPVGPVDIYGWSKWFGEELCRWQATASGLKITLCRLFNTYGPRETNAHIVPEIIEQLRHGRKLRLGNTKPRRDYIYTSDIAKGLRLLAKVPPVSCQTVNIARGEDASVDELIALLSELLRESITVEVDHSRFRQSDKLVQKADTTKLRQLLSWQPEVPLRSGLRELLKYEILDRSLKFNMDSETRPAFLTPEEHPKFPETIG